MNKRYLQLTYAAAIAALFLLSADSAFAAGTDMPWEGPIDRIVDSLSGPVARAAGVAAIVLVGLGLAFSEGGGGFRKIVWACFGLVITFSATTFFLNFFGGGSGLTF